MSLGKTLIEQANVKYPSALDRFENRVVETGLLTAILEMNKSSRSIISPDLRQKAMNSQFQELNIPVMKKGNVKIKNQRSCKVECKESESGFVTIVWKTLVADVCMIPALYTNNLISKQFDFNKKLEEVTEGFRVAMEEDIATELDVAKNKIYNSGLIPSRYKLVGDAIQVQEKNRPYFFGDIASINLSDNFRGANRIIGSPELMSFVDFWANQGQGNQVNTAYQYPGKNFSFTTGVENGNGAIATGYVIPDGAIGLLTRIDVDAKNKHEATGGTRWFPQKVNGLPFDIGVKYNSECSDQSTLSEAGKEFLRATLVEHWQFSVDYAVVLPYNSDPSKNSSPIRKFFYTNK